MNQIQMKQEDIAQILGHVFTLITVHKAKEILKQEQAPEKEFLITPHSAQVISILRLLGFGYTTDEGQLRNQLIQIKTGEGKSLVTAVTLVVLALFGFDVYCGCYSRHLIERDQNEFKFLFEALKVDQFIHYGTIEQLCEKVINNQGSLREKVEDLILKNSI